MIPVPRVLGVLAAVALAATGCRQFAKPEVPTFLVSPSSLSFAARAGGLNPPHQFLTISEADAQPLGWTASTDAPWISLTTHGDTLPYFLGVGVGTGLAVGTYSGAIAVVRPSTGDVRAIPVTLTLLATTPLAGRWSGVRDSVTVTLTLAEGGGKASGVDAAQMRSEGANLFHISGARVKRLVVYFNREIAFADLGLAPEGDAAG